MKLSTLLLSSAALVVAGSAYAADLPAKKGAPAAKAATGCPAFGAGFFQIPGGDTCIKFSGYMRAEMTANEDGNDITPSARLEIDARSNTEIGAVRGYTRFNSSPNGDVTEDTDADRSESASSDRAYVSFAGFSVGKYGALTDIAPTSGSGFGSLAGDTGLGANYTAAMGPANVTVAVQTSAEGVAGSNDYLVGVSGSAGMLNYSVFGASVANDLGDGYAFVGQVSATAGAVTLGAFGGSAHGAGAYTGGDTLSGSAMADSSVYGIAGSYNYGAGKVFADYGQVNGADEIYEIGVQHNLAKNLYVKPSYYNDGASTFYLRINRDF